MSNEARIQKWREERLLVGDAARQERIDEVQRQRAEGDQAEQARRRGIIEDLLPNSESLERARLQLVRDRAVQRRRRRWRTALLLLLPVALTIAYLTLIATPMYEAKAVFSVQTGGADGGGAPTAGIFSVGAPAATLTDAFSTREYMLSPDLLRQLDTRDRFTAHFKAPGLDPLSRPHVVPALGIDDHAYFRRRVHVDIDVQASLLTLTVQARTPDDAVRFANRIVDLGQRRINLLANTIDADRAEVLERGVAADEAAFRAASSAVTQVQSRRGELSPLQTAATHYQLIGGLETQAADIEGRREELLANGLTESPVLPKLGARLAELRRQIGAQRGMLANAGGSGLQTSASLLEAATIRRDLARDKWQASLRTLEQARLSGLDHRRYLVMVARPVLPSIPTVGSWPYAAALVLVLSGLLYGLVSVVGLLRSARER